MLGSGDRGEAEDRSRWRREGAQLSSVGLLGFFDARDEDEVLGEQVVRGGGDGGHWESQSVECATFSDRISHGKEGHKSDSQIRC